MTYDFHIHSCLSACAQDDMSPANIAGFAKLCKIDAIAVADHNTALNLPAVMRACKAYGVGFLPAIETTTQEDIHILAYFPSIEAALEMGQILYKNLPNYAYDKNIWGNQFVMDEHDNILDKPQKLLSAATSLNLYNMKELCQSLGGLAVPAHIDKESTSLLSVLGFAPEDLPFEAYEVARPEHSLEKLVKSGRFPKNQHIITNSDAHTLAEIKEHPRTLPKNSPLYRFFAQQMPKGEVWH